MARILFEGCSMNTNRPAVDQRVEKVLRPDFVVEQKFGKVEREPESLKMKHTYLQ